MSETFDAGFAPALIIKDINLFIENAKAASTPTQVADIVGRIWDETNEALPGSDISLVYKHLRNSIEAA